MKPGIDFVGVSVSFFCHDGKDFLFIKGQINAATKSAVGILAEDNWSLERRLTKPSFEKSKKNTRQKGQLKNNSQAIPLFAKKMALKVIG